MNFWLNLSKTKKIISVVVFVLLLGAGLYLLWNSSRNNQIIADAVYKREAPTILGGAQTYEFIQNKIVSPRVKFLTVNSLDAKQGQTQKFSVVVVSDFSPKQVLVEVETAVGLDEVVLSKESNGTLPEARYSVDKENNLLFADAPESPSSTISFWVGERVVKNESDKNFVINVKIKEEVSKTITSPTDSSKSIFRTERIGSVILNWDRVCDTALGGDWDLSDPCVVSSPDGIDGGNLHVRNSATMILDADFGLNQNKSAIFEPLGIIVVNTNAQIKKGNIWKLPTDLTGAKEVISEKSPGFKYKRRYEFNPEALNQPNQDNGKTSIKLPKGKQIFQIASAESAGPKIVQATIDPLDVKVGDTQNLSLVVQSQVQIESVIAKIETDNGIIDLPLSLKGKTPATELIPPKFKVMNKELVLLDDVPSGKNISMPGVSVANAEANPENLAYSGSWVVKDTHTARYHTRFVVKDTNGVENSILMAWTDPCGTFTGGNRSLNTCSFSDVDGADNGNLTINSGQTITMLAGSTLVFNSGKSLIVNGVIAVANTAQIVKTNLWRIDADGDTWATNQPLVAQATQPAGKVRAYQAPNSFDCYDSNSVVNPGFVGYGYVHRGDGSFDYNCKNGIEIEHPNAISAFCEYNGTNYPNYVKNSSTPSPSAAYGWCNTAGTSIGGINRPYCSEDMIVAECGTAPNYHDGGCEQGVDGGVSIRTDIFQGCK